MEMDSGKQAGAIAVWAVTPGGAAMAGRIIRGLGEGRLFCTPSAADAAPAGATSVDRLSDAVAERFRAYRGHVFVMSAGIVVRVIAPLIQRKTIDPAVVVVDETGQFSISLLSGHLGGANELAEQVAGAVGGVPVITTATDVRGVPAIDVIARRAGLAIENPEAIKEINMALITGRPVWVDDPDGWLADHQTGMEPAPATADGPIVIVSEVQLDRPLSFLILRPRCLVAGIGCNRGTAVEELHEVLDATLRRFRLAPASLCRIATIDAKLDEVGLLALAEALDLPLSGFPRERLREVRGITAPSKTVEHFMGVPSVCEAAAIAGAGGGPLIVPKQKGGNVTVAVARMPSTSSGSAPAGPITSPSGLKRS